MADYSNPWLQQAADNNAYDTNLVKTNIPDDREDDFMRSSAGMYARREAARRAYANWKRMADVKDDEGMHDDHEYLHISEDGGFVYVRNDRDKSENKFDSWADALDYIASLHEDDKALIKDLEDEPDMEGEEVEGRRASYVRRDYTRRASRPIYKRVR